MLYQCYPPSIALSLYEEEMEEVRREELEKLGYKESKVSSNEVSYVPYEREYIEDKTIPF